MDDRAVVSGSRTPPHGASSPGQALCAAFYRDVVRPLLEGRPHSAALLGGGSEVLGYDTARSTDHGWGPRVVLLLDDERDVVPVGDLLDERLPQTFGGRPVRFGWDEVPVSHHVVAATLPAWLEGHLGVDATRGLSTRDWLLTPQQKLLEVAAGPVYADDDGSLSAARAALAWYPEQVWRWLLACAWRRLAQEEAFPARTAEVGDVLGARVVAARLVRDMVRLALLLARRYAPYGTWLGSAFADLPHDDDLPEHLATALDARDDEACQAALGQAWRCLARRQDASGQTTRLGDELRPYHSRPAQVLMADRFADACRAGVHDPWLRSLPLVGGVDQVCDSTDALADPSVCRRFAGLYPAGT